MIYKQKTFVLKNGDELVLRAPREYDASDLLKYLVTTSLETNFLLRTPEECDLTESAERAFIRLSNNDNYKVLMIGVLNNQIVGTCELRFNSKEKTKHRAEIGIALIQSAWGLGIGTIMFQEMIDFAKQQGVEQLELDFLDGNTRAEALYTKMGFVKVARKPNAIKQLDGTYVDEIFMIRPIN